MNCLKLSLAATILVAPVPALAASPMDGVWKADPATAKFSSKPNVFALTKGVYSCTSCVPAYKIAADGKPHPVAGMDYWDAGSAKVVDAKTIELSYFRNSALVDTSKLTASPDGKMLTVVSESADNAIGKSTISKTMAKRVAAAPTGSHETSGSWMSITDGAKFSEESMISTISMAGDMVEMKLGTGEHYSAKIGGPKVPFVGDKAGAMVAVTKVGDGFTETDFIAGKPIGMFTYVLTNPTTISLKSVDAKSGKTTTVMLKKQ